MPTIAKESLENLRHKVDLIDLLSSHLDLKRSGGYYKALCPFHDEKTPSFSLQRGSRNFHCFGCGAHGDAIEFVMRYLGYSFSDAVEYLAERYQVPLIYAKDNQEGLKKGRFYEMYNYATRLFHYFLIKSEASRDALSYLKQRGIDETFIKNFQIGFALKEQGSFTQALLSKGFTKEELLEAGLLTKTSRGFDREFFLDRIVFPIRDYRGQVIGFSARKYHESTFGGKYINSPEHFLFKKSKILYGLNYGRTRIAKERKVLIVEGQLDALRLISMGLNFTVAPLGTAFTESHVEQLLRLGVEEAALAFDADQAGIEAQIKTGHLLLKKGISVYCIPMEKGFDPDQLVREKGLDAFIDLFKKKMDYLSFYYQALSEVVDLNQPALKAKAIQKIKAKILEWEDPLLIHESCKKLAEIANVPISTLNVPLAKPKKRELIISEGIPSEKVLETDLLYLLLRLAKKYTQFIPLAKINLSKEMFLNKDCFALYEKIIAAFSSEETNDLLSLMIDLDQPLVELLQAVLEKKVDEERAEELFENVLQKILDRDWLRRRELIKNTIQNANISEEEALKLVKEFEALKNNRPIVKKP